MLGQKWRLNYNGMYLTQLAPAHFDALKNAKQCVEVDSVICSGVSIYCWLLLIVSLTLIVPTQN